MKKLLSLSLALILAFTSLGAGTAVFAKEDKSVTVEFSVFDGGVYTLEPKNIKVSSSLSDKYAEAVGYNDNIDEPSVLDAIIAAHIAMFGEGFMEYAPLNSYSSGWIYSAFGEETENASYYINGSTVSPSGMYYSLTSDLSDGDYVEYKFFQDYYPYSDIYTAFDKREVNIKAGQSVTLTLSGEEYDEYYVAHMLPAKNIEVTVNGTVSGTTDESGKITLKFDKIGTYTVSATGTYAKGGYDYKIFAPWCVVNVTNDIYDYVKKEILGAGEYLVKNDTDYSVKNAVNLLTYLNSGYDMSKFESTFVSSVKDSLDNNGGKLKNAYGSEDIGIYGAAITLLSELGYVPSDFYGYDIVSAFESVDLESAQFNPYYYRVAIAAAKPEYAKTLCDDLISKYYVLGKGLSYWGFSCDNTSHFIAAVSPYKEDYKEYIEDAKKVIKSYTKANGAFADYKYVTEVNTDSTALAMMAFASVGDTATAFKYYKNLVEGFESNKAGVFNYLGSANLYATRDALLGLEYFKKAIVNSNFEHPEEVYKTTVKKATTKNNGSIVKKCVLCGKTKKETIYYPKTITLSSTKYVYSGKNLKPSVTVKDSKGNKLSSNNYTVKYSNNKNVGTASVTITFKGNYSGSVKKTFKINPKGTAISSIKAKSKGFTVKLKKQETQTTGYQVQYALNKGFTKNKKTVNISKKSKSKTVSKLKGKKKYYVRARTYKTVNGTKYYSGWSSVKTVTTKK